MDSAYIPGVEHLSVLLGGSALKAHKEAVLLLEGVCGLGALGNQRLLLCLFCKANFSKESLGLRTTKWWWQEHVVENDKYSPLVILEMAAGQWVWVLWRQNCVDRLNWG